MATFSDFIVVLGDEFWLPGLITSEGKSSIWGLQDLTLISQMELRGSVCFVGRTYC
jgi:hypothetical protein